MNVAARIDVTGTRELVRATLRRDRVRIAIWVLSVALMVAVSAGSTKGLFPTQADLDSAAAASDNPAIRAFNGPPYALDTLGGEVAFQVGAPGFVIVGLMSIMMVGRLTRGEEEAGRLELVRSLPVGRHAPLLATGSVVWAMNVAVGVLVTISMLALGLAGAGSVAFGLAFTMVGLVFAAVTLVTAQVTDNTRLAYGMAGAVLAIAYAVRGIGDMGDGTVSWLSPIGWVQKTRAWAGERWWPFAVCAAAAGALVVVAGSMLARRDLGAGLVESRPGRARAAASLRTPLTLAMRLQRGTLIGWSVGVAFGGITYGAITNSIEAFVKDNPQLADMFVAAGGGTLVESYLATSIRVIALIGSGFSIQAMLRMRSEETGLRGEPLLATPVSRLAWAASHLVVALAGSLVVLVAAGLTTGVSAAIVTGDGGLVLRLLGAAIAYTPAMWIFVGIGVALIGLLPRAAAAAWAAIVLAFVIAMFGTVLDLPQWVLDTSPFEHVPLVPARPFEVLPVAILLAIAGVLVATGVSGFRRRDIG